MKNKELIFSFNKKDFRVDWYRASGPGGQKVNKCSSACRITHLESGLFSSSQVHRSAYRNKKEAFDKLVKMLIEHYIPKQNKERYAAGEKIIRTYNESKDFVKDHDHGDVFSYKETVGKGDLSEIVETRFRRQLDKPEDL